MLGSLLFMSCQSRKYNDVVYGQSSEKEDLKLNVFVPHHAENKKLVLIQGLDDFIVVDTKDVLLICRKDKEQEIKEYVAEVKRNKGDRFL